MSCKMSLIDSVAFEIFMFSSYSVIPVLNAFPAAIVLSSIRYLRLMCMHLDGDGESPALASSKYPTLIYVAESLTSGLCLTNYSL